VEKAPIPALVPTGPGRKSD